MKKWCHVTRSAAPVTQNRLSKPEDRMLQNATPLRKSAPGPPNSSDEHVSCTAPATENASLQILFKCPTPAIVFGNATKPSRFAHFWQGAQSFKVLQPIRALWNLIPGVLGNLALPLIVWYMFSNIYFFVYLIYQGRWPWSILVKFIPKEKSYWVSVPWMLQCY